MPAVVVGVLQVCLMIFFTLLFGRMVINLIAVFSRDWKPRGLALILVEVALSATDPPVHALRALLPQINLGGVRFDLSLAILMILTLLAINLLQLA